MNLTISNNQNENVNIFTKDSKELQKFLGAKQKHSDWVKYQIEKFGFKEGIDFIRPVGNNKRRGRPSITIFFTQEAANRIANHSQIRSENVEMVKDNFVAKSMSLEHAFADPEAAVFFFQQLVEQKRQIAESQKQLEQTQLQLQKATEIKDRAINRMIELKPTFDYVIKVLNSDNSFPIRDVAQELGMSSSKLNLLLKALGIQYKGSKRWYLSAKYLGNGYTDETTYINKYTGKAHGTMNWTQKGKMFIIQEINKAKEELMNIKVA